MEVVEGCPDLQEISVKDTIGSIRIPVVSPRLSETPGAHTLIDFTQADTKPVERLRALRHLAVVELDFITSPFHPDETGTAKSDLYRTQVEMDLKAWKACVVEILKDSPSKERKFLRWKVYKSQRPHGIPRGIHVVVEEGELEVFPETSL